jgi:hypothetical protein
MTIEAAIANLQAKILSLSGVKSAPVKPPESAAAFPFGVSYERSGSLASHSAIFADELCTIWCELHVSRTLLGNGIAQAQALRDPFLKLLIADPTLGGNVSTLRDVRWTFGKMVWADVETIGFRFEVDVKIQVSV